MSHEEFETLRVGDRLTNIAGLNGVIITHRVESDEGHITFVGVLPVQIDDPADWVQLKSED